jgi:hypothetical protein
VEIGVLGNQATDFIGKVIRQMPKIPKKRNGTIIAVSRTRPFGVPGQLNPNFGGPAGLPWSLGMFIPPCRELVPN